MNCEKILEIEKNLPNDWKFLEKIYEILNDENIFNTSDSSKVVKFSHPHELKNELDLSINTEGNLKQIEIVKLLKDVIKNSVKTNHPLFKNQLFGQLDPLGLVGAWITEALNTSSYTYEVGPVFSLIETEVIQTFCSLFGFKDGDGIFSPGGSMSNMYGLVLARFVMCPEIKHKGSAGMPPLVVFTSEESHYSLQKACNWLGIGMDNCITIKTNDYGQMIPKYLENKILKAIDDGKRPIFVNATSGTTVLGAFDKLSEIGDICEKYKLWFHVDACYGGAVILSKNYSYLLNGCGKADSLAWNPHKSLGAPLQCSMFLTKHKNLLAKCNSINVNYLFQQDKFYDVSYDTGNKSLQCGRKVDAFKLWIMLKARGLNDFGALIDNAIQNAKIFCKKLKSKDGFRLVLDEYEFTNVCFWYIPSKLRNLEENDEWTARLEKIAPKIKEKMVKSGKVMLGYSPLKYKNLVNFFRLSLTCFPIMTENQLDFIIEQIEIFGEECCN